MRTRIRHATLLGILLISAILLVAGPALGQQPRGLAVPGTDLPDDLRDFAIKDYYVPSNFERVGVIHGLNGHVVVVHRADNQAFFGKPGDPIFENDEIYTLDASRVRLRFTTEDVVNLAPNTRFGVDEFEDNRRENKKTSLFSMIKGKAMFYALRLFRYRDARFRVKTPTAVVGVRGTKFGVDIFWTDKGATVDSRGVLVADSGRGFDLYLAQAGQQGLQSGTIVACGDGALDLLDPQTGQQFAQVFPNEDFNTLTQQKTFDPANLTLQNIQGSSEVLEEGEEPKKPEVLAPPSVPADIALDEYSTLFTQDFFSDTNEIFTEGVNTTNTQSDQEILDLTDNCSKLPVFEGVPFDGTSENPLMGYFAVLVKLQSAGTIYDVFASSSLCELDPEADCYGYACQDPGDYIHFYDTEDGGEEDTLHISGEGVSDPFSFVGEDRYVGQLNYLQWGYSVPDNPIYTSVGSSDYEIYNLAWFIEGYPTHTDSLSDLASHGSEYSYTGEAYGTYYDSSSSENLLGTYSSHVNFGTGKISNFVMDLAGCNHSVEFTQSGSASVDTMHEGGPFSISSGTFKIDGSEMGCWSVQGAHFGPEAKEQGGVWSGSCPESGVGAWGVFGGSRP